MKKKILATLLAVAVVCSMAGCGSAKEETKESASVTSEAETEKKEYRDTDFRNGKWGDSMETVREAEGVEAFGGNDTMLMYKADICGQEGKVMYVFDNSGLYSVVYDITNDELSASDWLDYYEKLKTDLAEKYDEPVEDSVVSLKGDKVEATPELLGKGEISLQTGWVNDKVNIWMQLMSDDDNHFFISVVAISPKVAMQELASEADETKSSDSVEEPAKESEAESVEEAVAEEVAVAESNSEITDEVPEIEEDAEK